MLADTFGNYTTNLNSQGAHYGAGSSGSGGDNQEGNYGGGEPSYTPASSPSFATDTSDGHIWWYFDGAWHG